jgi:hypothetical protein
MLAARAIAEEAQIGPGAGAGDGSVAGPPVVPPIVGEAGDGALLAKPTMPGRLAKPMTSRRSNRG